VLFADFVGFTTLSEELDAEVLQELVSGIFEDLAEQAVAHDGTIEKFIGDAIFVIFGAPIAHEDDPQRALRTALAMHRVFGEHAAKAKKDRGIELGLRIGVHTGMVVAGNVRSVAGAGPMRPRRSAPRCAPTRNGSTRKRCLVRWSRRRRSSARAGRR